MSMKVFIGEVALLFLLGVALFFLAFTMPTGQLLFGALGLIAWALLMRRLLEASAPIEN